jgi:hypothetical protein
MVISSAHSFLSRKECCKERTPKINEILGDEIGTM